MIGEETPNDAARRFARQVLVLTSILADREAELFKLKGPCREHACRLHYAHSGPCDIRKGD